MKSVFTNDELMNIITSSYGLPRQLAYELLKFRKREEYEFKGKEMDVKIIQKMRHSNKLQVIINSGIKEAIKAHGPIEMPLIESVSKRIIGQLKNQLGITNGQT